MVRALSGYVVYLGQDKLYDMKKSVFVKHRNSLQLMKTERSDGPVYIHTLSVLDPVKVLRTDPAIHNSHIVRGTEVSADDLPIL